MSTWELRFAETDATGSQGVPPLDVITQARTKKQVLESLRQAVEAWFESCIDRGVLEEALTEAGFAKVPKGAAAGDVNVVKVAKKPEQPAIAQELSFSLGHHKGAAFIEGSIPSAYIAAHQLGTMKRAPA